MLFCHFLQEVSLLDINWGLCYNKILIYPCLLNCSEICREAFYLLITSVLRLPCRIPVSYRYKWGLDLLDNSSSHVAGLVLHYGYAHDDFYQHMPK